MHAPTQRHWRRLATVVVALLVGMSAAQAANLTVAPDGSGQFTQIQAAVNAAVDGDVVWVSPGSYAPVTIVGKAILIVGSGSGTTHVSSLAISSLSSGLVGAASVHIVGATSATNVLGTLLLRDDTGGNLSLANCAEVFIERWNGKRATSQNVPQAWITNSHFEGLPGKNAVPGPLPGTWSTLPTAGTSAFDARASRLQVAGSQFIGGAGGKGSCLLLPGFLPGAPGGAGLADVLGNCSFLIGQSSFTGGAGGLGGLLCQFAPDGAGLSTKPGTKLEWDQASAPLFPLSVETPSFVGQKTTLKISGVPGDLVLLLISDQSGTVGLSDVAGYPLGAFLGGTAHVTYWWLTRPIGPDGTLIWKHKIPDAPSLAGTPVFIQACLVAPPTGVQHLPTLTGVSVSIVLP